MKCQEVKKNGLRLILFFLCNRWWRTLEMFQVLLNIGNISQDYSKSNFCSSLLICNRTLNLASPAKLRVCGIQYKFYISIILKHYSFTFSQQFSTDIRTGTNSLQSHSLVGRTAFIWCRMFRIILRLLHLKILL